MAEKRKTMSDRIRAFDIGSSTADALGKGIDKLPVSPQTQATLKSKAAPVVAGAAAGAVTFASAAVDAGTRAYDATKVGARAAKPDEPRLIDVPDVPEDEADVVDLDGSVPDKLDRLVRLHESGVLDDEEFAAAKRQTLGL
ncbi:SHOCT domain-containing protein [Cellulomonas sp. PhB150]|uniref:SHOCT domain-containing protein n=1 Tax=Cellulomonas sp. PhB150 TaxID=2485188 RepID=UPI000F4988AE|nr:SHOCT domain-containing protein [Cellulomonas sp. PhB150]ROS31717.1 putative oligomerization/nucleic acid binding protein [Cellulomonas sp. PhB150]